MAHDPFPEDRMEAALESVMKAAAKLNEAADYATSIITETEGRLREASPGVEVFGDTISTGRRRVEIRNEEQEIETYLALCYTKADGQWCLAVHELYYLDELNGDATPVETTPLLRCDRATRVRALSALPDLVEQIAAAVKDLADKACDSPEPAREG